MKKVTIKDVAREAGVSVTLVSFVMNAKMGKDGRLDCPVNPNTAANVLKVAKKLGYRKNAAAASLRSGRSNTIAVITTDISNKFFAGVSRYIEDKAYSYDYTVLFGSSDEDASKLESMIDTVLSYNVDGIIVAPVPGGGQCIERAVESKVPVVLLDRDIEGLRGIGKVLLDDISAGRMATELLLDNGYRKIEMISYTLGISSLSEREEGYKQSMHEHNLSANIHYTTYGAVDKDVRNIIEDALQRGVDAFFLPTYSLCAKTLQIIKEKGLSVPKDLALVGFDESDVYSLYSNTVAHIVQPLKELGEKSVELLHNMIEGIPSDRTIILKPTLIKGESAERK